MIIQGDKRSKRHKQQSTAVSSRLSLLNLIPKVASTVAILVGCVVLVGWTLNIDVLKRILPGLVAMNPATAIAFVIAGAATRLLLNKDVDRRPRRLAQGLALVVTMVGLLKLVEILFGWDLGIDQLLFRQGLESEATVTGVPNQMAPNTALNFLLVGCALLLVDRPTGRSYWLAQFLILVAAAASLLALIGYAYGVKSLYGVSSYIPMALHTALTFIALLAGLLCARPDRGLIAIVVSNRVGGVIARRLLPAAIFVPVVLGWLRLKVQQVGLYDSELGVALMVVSSIAIFAVLVMWSARLLNRTDIKREQAEEELRWAYSELEIKVQERTAELATTNSALQKRAEELTRSNAELEQFAYVASHDLQEPLRMVSSYTQLLARRYRGKLDDDADEFIAYAVDGATRMQTLINDLLAYSHVGTRGSEHAPTDVQRVFEVACANLRMAIEESGAEVASGELPTVIGDEIQLGQLFQNLIGNALKFRGERPIKVSVEAESRDREWLFSVRDNGIGIEPQYAERIFLIFQRLHGKAEYAGTGIGLAVCKKIVERHGGRIWAESQPGEGSAFYFTLPALK